MNSPTRRVTLCIETADDDRARALLMAWFDRWQGKLVCCSENLGCGCCVDIFELEAPIHALDELPASFFADRIIHPSS